MKQDLPKASGAIAALFSTRAIRERCQEIYDYVQADRSPYFSLHLDKMSETTDLLIEITKRQYPSLEIPYHSRWRHFEVEGSRSYTQWRQQLAPQAMERGRSSFDTVIISVLLDAGAGAAWSYRDLTTGQSFRSSEGLAIASLDLMQAGFFSLRPREPLRVDALQILSQKMERFKAHLQHSEANPLQAIEGRWLLLQNLAVAMQQHAEIFLRDGSVRLGHFFDYLVMKSEKGTISALTILESVLSVFGSIWPGRLAREGQNLGDCWSHSAVSGEGPTAGLVPFHKLSQWLTYSLLEPLEEYGLRVTAIEALTGLPEYRNGGLFVDTGVIEVKPATWAAQPLNSDHEALIEWRALTVVLLDALAESVRKKLGLNAAALPLAKVLQGGTWAAGRLLAQEKRQGAPPLAINLEGTVF